VRVQLSSNLHTPSTEVLSVMTPLGLCLVDSCSDVTLARRDVLSSLHLVASPVVIAHLGGDTILREAGSLTLGVPGAGTTLHDVLAVDVMDLPAGVVALIGVADVRLLGISLDAILARPGCDLAEAIGWRRMPRDSIPAVPESSSSEEASGRSWENLRRFKPPTEEEARRFLGMKRSTLQELQQRAQRDQEEPTVERIGQLFLGSPPTKKSPVKHESSAVGGGAAHASFSSAPAPPRVPSKQKKGKYYAVRVGRRVGVFRTCEECQDSVKGYSGAQFKAFPTLSEAEAYVNDHRA
jgi:hypothetical protein